MPKTNAPTKKQDDSDGPAKPGGELGKDAFMKLLVTQLKYQDPSNPMDNREFLAQTAQFSTLEKLNDVAEAEQSLLNAQLQLGASNLIGKTVTYAGADGKALTGVVTSAKFFTAGPPTLHVGNTDVPLASVSEVTDKAAPPQTGQNAPTPATPQTTPATQQTAPAQGAQPGSSQQPGQGTQPGNPQTAPTQGTQQQPPTQAGGQQPAQGTQQQPTQAGGQQQQAGSQPPSPSKPS
ncbi:flagellar hook capping FlgD N-terminal domain-containing protein [Dactylosporangium sp. CS-047395]|uniref:flagellar hook capping FlgD N-terminal domain-containing protein n=1 Tax=Dactylosporangium sp. CS-047395 TaxID=3239936 RepID=UPI003D8F18BC